MCASFYFKEMKQIEVCGTPQLFHCFSTRVQWHVHKWRSPSDCVLKHNLELPSFSTGLDVFAPIQSILKPHI